MEQAHFWLLREQREATTQLRTQRRSQAAPGRPEAAGVAPQARLPLPAPPPASAPAPSSGSGNHRQSSALCSAVLAGSTEAVEDLVAAGACAGRSGGAMGRGHPALHAVVLAAQRGEAGMLEAMYPSLEQELKGGSAAMVGALCRRTALHPLAAAAERGQLAAVEVLLQLGAPPNHDASMFAGVLGCTPLMLAAGSGHLAVVERLLAADADPLKLDSRGETAAARALRQGHLEVVRRLLQHGGEMGAEAAEAEAGLTAPDVGACSQVASASRSWQLGFPSGPPSCPCSLSPAALESEQRHYRLLLYHFLQAHAGGCGGAGSSSSSNGGAAARVRQLATPAAVAHAAAGSEALLGALLACGVRPCCVDPRDGSFPLLIAARHRDGWQPMQRLLARGADVNQADSRGDTAAMLLAARPALLGTVRQLLRWSGREEREGREGAPSSSALDLSRLNSEGRDAVGVALAANNRRCGELLLEHQVARQQGALEARTAASPGLQQDSSAAASRSSMPAPRGAPAAEVSAAAVASLAWRLLRGQGARRLADINRPHSGGRHLLVSQVSRASRKQLRLLAALPGLDLNARDPLTGRTPLMLAAERGDPGIAQDLLGTGQADVGARDARGATAALLAARAGQGATLRVLLSAGADPACADASGDTPLMALARRGQHKLLSELLRGPARASLDAQDSSGWSALHHAAAAGQAQACGVLRGHGADASLLTGNGRTALELARGAGHAPCLPFLKLPASA